MPKERRKLHIILNNELLDAYNEAGREEEYFNTLIKRVKEAKNEEIPELGKRFPEGASRGLLMNNPEKAESFKLVVEAYGERGIMRPAQALWCQAFILRNYTEAREIHDKYLKEEILHISPILEIASNTDSQAMIEELISVLNTKKNNTATEALAIEI